MWRRSVHSQRLAPYVWLAAVWLTAAIGQAWAGDSHVSAGSLLPQAVCLAGGGWWLWRRGCVLAPTEWVAVAFCLWVVAVDCVRGTAAVSFYVWLLACLLLFLALRRLRLSVGAIAAGVSVLSVGIALHLVAYSCGWLARPLFSNVAGYAAALVAGLCFMGYAAGRRHGARRGLVVAGMAVVGTALCLTASRSGAVGLGMAAGVGLIVRAGRQRKRLGVVLMVVMTAGVAGLYTLRRASADGRLLIYEASARCILRHPLMGHGTWGFHRHYMEEQAAVMAARPDHPARQLADNAPYAFCVPLGMAFRHGLTGLLLFALLLWRVARDGRRGPCAVRGLTYSLWAGLAGVGLFSYPFAFSYVTLLFVTGTSFVDAAAEPFMPGSSGAPSIFSRPTRVVLSVLAVSGLSLTWRQWCGELQWDRGEALYAAGCHREALAVYAGARQSLGQDPVFLYGHAVRLNFEGRHAASDSVLSVCRRRLVNYDTELLAADNALAQSRHSVARRHLRQAHRMIPSRFMPWLGEMQLCEAEGDTCGRRAAARRILRQPVKVPSAETERIRREAWSVLEDGR